jgi:pimeloyl-ACP methyl ester carboxylesterase
LRSHAGTGPVHVVAHSLGGLIAGAALDHVDALPGGRLVCLGSPLAGSSAARGLREKRLGLVSGRSGNLLREGLPRLPPGREVGMVAGTRAMGLGRFFGRFEGPNDGTVAVSETRMPGLTGHVEIASSHTGLVFSEPVADLVDRFLRHGSF